MPNYRLTYFPLRARGEIPRLLFAAAGVQFEDVRIPFNEWPAQKQKFGFGQLPVLEVDGQQLSQSYAIIRYLANEFGFGGKDKWEAAQADMYTGVVEDLFVPAATIKFGDDDAAKKAELLKKFVEETGPKYLQPVENALAKSKSGYFVGDGLTYADLAFLSLFEFLEGALPNDGKALIARFPNLQKHRERIAALPKIASWISSRPPSDV